MTNTYTDTLFPVYPDEIDEPPEKSQIFYQHNDKHTFLIKAWHIL